MHMSHASASFSPHLARRCAFTSSMLRWMRPLRLGPLTESPSTTLLWPPDDARKVITSSPTGTPRANTILRLYVYGTADHLRQAGICRLGLKLSGPNQALPEVGLRRLHPGLGLYVAFYNTMNCQGFQVRLKPHPSSTLPAVTFRTAGDNSSMKRLLSTLSCGDVRSCREI